MKRKRLQRLQVEGRNQFCTDISGEFRITAANPDFVKQMEVAKKGMRRYRNALRELAQ